MINNLTFDDDGQVFTLTSDGIVTRTVSGETVEGGWLSTNGDQKNRLTLTLGEEQIEYSVRYRFLNQETDTAEQANVLKVAVLGDLNQVLGEARFHGTIKADDAKDLDYVLNDGNKFTLYGDLALQGDYTFLNIRLEGNEKDVARVTGEPIIQKVVGSATAGRTLAFGFACYTYDSDAENDVEFESDGEIGLQGTVKAMKNGLTFVGSVAEGADDVSIALIGNYDAYSGGIRVYGDPQNPGVQFELAGEWKLNAATGDFSLSLTKDEEGTLNFQSEFEFSSDETGANGESGLKGNLKIAREGGDGEIEIVMGLKGNVQMRAGRKLVFELEANKNGKKVDLSLKGTLTWSSENSFAFQLGYSDDNVEVTIHLKTEKLNLWISIIQKPDGTAAVGIRMDLQYDLAGNLSIAPVG